MWQTWLNATHIGVRTLDGLVRKIVQCLVGNIMALFFFGGVWKTEEDETNYILVLNVSSWFNDFFLGKFSSFCIIWLWIIPNVCIPNVGFHPTFPQKKRRCEWTLFPRRQICSRIFFRKFSRLGFCRWSPCSEITVGVPFMTWLNHIFMGIYIHVVINDYNCNLSFFWCTNSEYKRILRSWDGIWGMWLIERCATASSSERILLKPMHTISLAWRSFRGIRRVWMEGASLNGVTTKISWPFKGESRA